MNLPSMNLRSFTGRLAVTGAVLSLVAGSFATSALPSSAEPRGQVESWLTDLATDQRLSQQPSTAWIKGAAQRDKTLIVDPTKRYQAMTGFGASMTDTSATVLTDNLDDNNRESIMKDLFSSEEGIGLSMLRQPMGASDLSAHGSYSYDDQPAGETDPELADFSIDHDRQSIIPRLQEALALNPDLTLMASPWSPPGWMKTSDSMTGGVLKPEYYDAYATYFARFLTDYAAAGLPTNYISVQNEPLYSPADYPGQNLPAEDAATFIGDHLGPAVAATELSPQILGYDHNWDNSAYPESMFTDPRTAPLVPGTAWHCYGGDVGAQSLSHNNFPDRQAFLTECSGGEWQGTETDAFRQTMASVIGVPRNWGQSVVLWNLALDENNGPGNGGCTTCRGVVTASRDGTVTKELEYWGLGHASKFVRPGAARIASSEGPVTNVAYANPDGTQVLVAHNPTAEAQDFSVQVGHQHFTTTLAAGAAATYRWDDPGNLRPARTDLGWADLDFGQGPEGTPGGRLMQSVSPELVEAYNQIKINKNWLGYSLPYGASLRPAGESVELAREGWSVTASSSAEGDVPSHLIDGDPATRWSSGAGQAPGDWIQLDLGAVQSFNEVVLDSGASGGDYARRYQVETSTDGQTWIPIARGQGIGPATTIVLPPTTSRYVRIVGGASSGSWWSVHELALRQAGSSEPAGSDEVAYDESKINKDTARLSDGTRLTGLYNGSAETTTIQVPIAGLVYDYRLPATAAVSLAKIR